MSDFNTPQEQAAWEERARRHLAMQSKLKTERDRLKATLETLEVRLQAAEAQKNARHVEYLTTYGLLQAEFLRRIELFNIDSDTLNPVDPAALAAAELGELEAGFYLLKLQVMNLEELETLLSADLEAARTGQPPTGAYPAAWLKVRKLLPHQHAWNEALSRFMAEFPALKEQVRRLSEAFAEADPTPGAARLAQVKAIGIPAAKGAHFRLEALFRPLPHGDDLMGAMRVLPEDFAKESAQAAKPTKSLTDRVLKIFNKR